MAARGYSGQRATRAAAPPRVALGGHTQRGPKRASGARRHGRRTGLRGRRGQERRREQRLRR